MKRTHYKSSIPINDIWDDDRFFYIDDIRKTCKSLNLHTTGKKDTLLLNIRNHIKQQQEKTPHLHHICIIQKAWRNYIKNRQWRGPGFMQKRLCTNTEDFYTLDSIEETGDTFFFSYRDENEVIFFFDIRSFEKLVSSQSILNPFTRQSIPDNAIHEFKKRKEYLDTNKLWKPLEDDVINILTPEQKLKLRVVDVVTDLNMLDIVAGGVQTDWFLGLSLKQLKLYYAALEDVWNYRAGLSKKQKSDIVPNIEKMRKLFPYPVKTVVKSSSHLLNYEKMITMLMNTIEILISSSQQMHHKITAGNYVIIALTEVSPQVAAAVPWLAQNNY